MNETVPCTGFQQAGRKSQPVQTGPSSHRTYTDPIGQSNMMKKPSTILKLYKVVVLNGPPALTVIPGNWGNLKRKIDPRMDSWSANACVDFVQHMLRLKPD